MLSKLDYWKLNKLMKIVKKVNSANMQRKRALSISCDAAISKFLSKVKSGPDYICTV